METHHESYLIRLAFPKFIRMKLVIDEVKKTRITVKMFGKSRKTNIIRQRKGCLEVQFNIGIVMIDMVCIFREAGQVSGFFDTPLGNIGFTGFRQ